MCQKQIYYLVFFIHINNVHINHLYFNKYTVQNTRHLDLSFITKASTHQPVQPHSNHEFCCSSFCTFPRTRLFLLNTIHEPNLHQLRLIYSHMYYTCTIYYDVYHYIIVYFIQYHYTLFQRLFEPSQIANKKDVFEAYHFTKRILPKYFGLQHVELS